MPTAPDSPPTEARETSNSAQVDYWNAAAGETWAQLQELLDRQVAPLGAQALRALEVKPGEHLLDIGCGCGQTTLDLAALAGSRGRVMGVDISRPMLEVARRRPLSPTFGVLEFREVDAQSGDLGHDEFDAAYSRFGVMFFSNPVAAFMNVRRSLKRRGRLAFVCWQSLAANPWMREPLEAAAPFLPPPSAAPADPRAPGPFAFADADRLRSVLNEAGFEPVSIDPFSTVIGGGDLEESLRLAFRVGPLGAALREHPDAQPRAADAVRAVLSRHATPRGVLMPASVWIIRAAAADL